MKVLSIFSAILAVASSAPLVKTWMFREMVDAIDDHDPVWETYLIEPFNQIMEDLDFYFFTIPSPSGAHVWTWEELEEAVKDKTLSIDYENGIYDAYHYLKRIRDSGSPQDTMEVKVLGVDISIWTLADLNEALHSPATEQKLRPYLLEAKTKLLSQNLETVGVMTPVGLIPQQANDDSLLKPLRSLLKNTKNRLLAGGGVGRNNDNKYWLMMNE